MDARDLDRERAFVEAGYAFSRAVCRLRDDWSEEAHAEYIAAQPPSDAKTSPRSHAMNAVAFASLLTISVIAAVPAFTDPIRAAIGETAFALIAIPALVIGGIVLAHRPR